MTDGAPVIEDAVAIVPVRDVVSTVDFYADILGFERRIVSEDETFAIVVHGDAVVNFIKADSEEALHATANHISLYIWVHGVDALYEALKPGLDQLAEGRVRSPFDRPYGMREFHVRDPDGCLLFFGQKIRANG